MQEDSAPWAGITVVSVAIVCVVAGAWGLGGWAAAALAFGGVILVGKLKG